jgi:hypothetical protein
MSVTIPPDIFTKSFLLFFSAHSLRTADKPAFEYIRAIVGECVPGKSAFTEHRVDNENPDLTITRGLIREVTREEMKDIASKV